MHPGFRYLLMTAFALPGAGGSQFVRPDEALVILGAVMGALAGAAIARRPRATNRFAVSLCLIVLVVLSILPVKTQETVICDWRPP